MAEGVLVMRLSSVRTDCRPKPLFTDDAFWREIRAGLAALEELTAEQEAAAYRRALSEVARG